MPKGDRRKKHNFSQGGSKKSVDSTSKEVLIEQQNSFELEESNIMEKGKSLFIGNTTIDEADEQVVNDQHQLSQLVPWDTNFPRKQSAQYHLPDDNNSSKNVTVKRSNSLAKRSKQEFDKSKGNNSPTHRSPIATKKERSPTSNKQSEMNSSALDQKFETSPLNIPPGSLNHTELNESNLVPKSATGNVSQTNGNFSPLTINSRSSQNFSVHTKHGRGSLCSNKINPSGFGPHGTFRDGSNVFAVSHLHDMNLSGHQHSTAPPNSLCSSVASFVHCLDELPNSSMKGREVVVSPTPSSPEPEYNRSHRSSLNSKRNSASHNNPQNQNQAVNGDEDAQLSIVSVIDEMPISKSLCSPVHLAPGTNNLDQGNTNMNTGIATNETRKGSHGKVHGVTDIRRESSFGLTTLKEDEEKQGDAISNNSVEVVPATMNSLCQLVEELNRSLDQRAKEISDLMVLATEQQKVIWHKHTEVANLRHEHDQERLSNLANSTRRGSASFIASSMASGINGINASMIHHCKTLPHDSELTSNRQRSPSISNETKEGQLFTKDIVNMVSNPATVYSSANEDEFDSDSNSEYQKTEKLDFFQKDSHFLDTTNEEIETSKVNQEELTPSEREQKSMKIARQEEIVKSAEKTLESTDVSLSSIKQANDVSTYKVKRSPSGLSHATPAAVAYLYAEQSGYENGINSNIHSTSNKNLELARDSLLTNMDRLSNSSKITDYPRQSIDVSSILPRSSFNSAMSEGGTMNAGALQREATAWRSLAISLLKRLVNGAPHLLCVTDITPRKKNQGPRDAVANVNEEEHFERFTDGELAKLLELFRQIIVDNGLSVSAQNSLNITNLTNQTNSTLAGNSTIKVESSKHINAMNQLNQGGIDTEMEVKAKKLPLVTSTKYAQFDEDGEIEVADTLDANNNQEGFELRDLDRENPSEEQTESRIDAKPIRRNRKKAVANKVKNSFSAFNHKFTSFRLFKKMK